MPKTDLRRLLDPHRQEELRRRSIEMLDKGMKPSEISEELGVSLASVYNWRKRHRDGGVAALETKPRRGGPKKKVDEALLTFVAELVTLWLPDQRRPVEGLWTRALIGEEIDQTHNQQLSRWTLWRMWRRLGLQHKSPKPTRWVRQSAELSAWAEKQLSRHKDETAKSRTRLYLIDVSPVRAESPVGRRTARGSDQPPRRWMISAVALRGDVCFMIAPQAHMDANFREFIDQLMKGNTGQVVLVVGADFTLPREIAQECVKKFEGRLRLFKVSSFETGEVPLEFPR